MKTPSIVLGGLLFLAGMNPVFAQRPGQPRQHTATVARPLDLVPATEQPPARTEVTIEEEDGRRHIESNGMPAHRVGEFPNRNNPNAIREQDYDIVIPSDPEPADRITFMHQNPGGRGFRVFGITLDGVLMEPGTAESWMGRREWNYEALGGAVALGLDDNYAHVQPDGNYHYHGLPIDLMKRLGYRSGNHSPMIGWAADGFPIYAMYGFADPGNSSSEIVELKTGYRLREGTRPGGNDAPGGRYDGAFLQDYEFVAGAGDLDECNGRHCVTPEFPEGTYAYFLTREWPVIPRAFRGTPTELKEPDFGGAGRDAPRESEMRENRPPGGRPPFPPGRPPGGPGGGPPPRR